jgi:hypothetical protein
MSPVSAEADAAALNALPLLETRPQLPVLPPLPSPPLTTSFVSSEEDDEPTRHFSMASVISADTPPQQPVVEVHHHKPPPPIRQHAHDSVSQLRMHAAPAPSAPEQLSEVTAPVATSSSSTELPVSATTTKTHEQSQPVVATPAVVPPSPAVVDYPEPIGVQSTSPTALDLSTETDEAEAWQKRPKRTALVLSAGLGGGAVALGLALFMRGSSPAPTPAAAAIPLAAVATSSPVQAAAINPAATVPVDPPASESSAQPEPAVSAKPAKLKAVATRAPDTERTERAATKPPIASATQPVAQPPESEPADEEEPFNAREAASALDEAAEKASACRREDDQSGVAIVTVTFAPSGRVTTATIGGPPFLGTPTGSCIASTMRSARVSAFSGKHVTVRKTVTIR